MKPGRCVRESARSQQSLARTSVVPCAVVQQARPAPLTAPSASELLQTSRDEASVASTSGRSSHDDTHSVLHQRQQRRRQRAEADWRHYAGKLRKSMTRRIKRDGIYDSAPPQRNGTHFARLPSSLRDRAVSTLGADGRDSRALLAALVLCEVANTQSRLYSFDVTSPKAGKATSPLLTFFLHAR